MKLNRRKPHAFRRRRGGLLTTLAFLLPILCILGSFAINIAYLQLTRTELMVATDASARAGGRAISFFQDVEKAKTTAQLAASLNEVSGRALRLQTEDEKNEIEFGETDQGGSGGRYYFSKSPSNGSDIDSSEIVNAIRVRGKLSNSTLTGAVRAIFPTFGMKDSFDLEVHSVAMQVDRDIVLVLDRSGSMDWADFDWPSGFDPYSKNSLDAGVAAGILNTPNGSNYYLNDGFLISHYEKFIYEEHLSLGTAPPTPWESLVSAVDTFLDVLKTTDQSEQVALATYASTGALDRFLESNYDLIQDTLNQRVPNGGTAIGLGMQAGLTALTDEDTTRAFARKTMIVMTDGLHGIGITPDDVADDIVASHDITIHTVTFGSGADQIAMKEVATIGGGNHYHAATGQDLNAVFEEIANNLPTLVTK